MSSFQRGRGGGRGTSRGGGRSSPARGSPARGSPAPRGEFRGGQRGGQRGGTPQGGVFREGQPLPQQSPSANTDQLVRAFQAVNISDPARPLRPDYGTLGTPITLRANFFAVRVPKRPIYDYNVITTPRTDINRLKTRIFQLLEQDPLYTPHRGYVAHDWSERLVSAQKLPQPLDIRIPYYDESAPGPTGNKVYNVAIVFERELDLTQLNKYTEGQVEFKNYDPLPLLSALNLILQEQASHSGVRVGKSRYFFETPGSRQQLGPGLAAWQGFYSSVRPVYKQLMVNVNVCMSAFIEPGNMADALQAFNRGSRGAMPTLPKDFVKSLKVTTQHLGYKRRYPLKAIGTTSARNTFFDSGALGGRVSVEQYFKKTYNITLQHPADLPVIDVGREKHSYIPAELCYIESGQAFRGKLGDRETASMIRYACNPPNVNAEAIVGQGFTQLGLSPLSHVANGFGITVDTEMTVIPGRELNPPSLTYRAGRANVKNGSWNILDVKFHRGANVQSWWVLVVRDRGLTLQGKDDPRLKSLVDAFTKKLQNSGMSIPNALPRLLITSELQPVESDPQRLRALGHIKQTFLDALRAKNNEKPSFVLVLLSQRDNYIYPGIKRIGDVELGIQTIHMQLSKVIDHPPNKQDQYFSNVALKVNTKLGGVNHLLDANAMRWLTKRLTMLVGIDVTHPSPTSKEGSPSIAAVVANTDQEFVQFPASMRIQESKKEMLDELMPMLIERLEVYRTRNKKLPDRVFVFRDGVSEGQYDKVLREELPQILDAFKRIKSGYRPQLAVVICGKRHHARFYPTNSQFADRNGNTRPGTVVDKGVTAVFDFDFYLQAHAGLQGTVRPTHYIVIYDECGLSANEIQEGTNNVSYLYARATKAVSLMPPAYYADLACERGRCYLNDLLGGDKQSSAGGKPDKEAEKARVYRAAEEAWGQGIHADIRGTMFYI